MRIRYLTYHKTSASPAHSDIHVVEQGIFERQIDLLCQCDVLIADPRIIQNKQVSGDYYAVGLTFDDGCESDLSNARYLKEKGINGIFFVSTANIDTPGFLSRAQILEMRDMGMVIGSHSHEHRALNLMPINEAQGQLVTSKMLLEDMLGETVEHLAFPGGGHNREVVAAAHGAGFNYLYTTIWGANRITHSTTAVLRRDTVVRSMTMEQFYDLITGRSDFQRRSVYFCKQIARSFLPRGAFQALRRYYIDG